MLIDRRRAGVEVCLEWWKIQLVVQAAYPEGSDAVSVEIPLEVSSLASQTLARALRWREDFCVANEMA